MLVLVLVLVLVLALVLVLGARSGRVGEVVCHTIKVRPRCTTALITSKQGQQ